jgi:plasmid maintenance system antidote protein VapI
MEKNEVAAAQTVGDRLIMLIEARGLSRSKAARTVGVPEVTFSSHCNGTRGLRKKVAEDYAFHFRTSASWLLFGRGDMNDLDVPDQLALE